MNFSVTRRVGLSVIVASFILRIILAFTTPGHRYDLGIFHIWGRSLSSKPWSEFYQTSGVADHLPGDLFLHGLISVVSAGVGWLAEDRTYFLVLKMSAVIFEAALCLAVFWCVKASIQADLAWSSAALVAISPGMMMVSSIWGQWDALSVLLVVLAITFYGRAGARPEISGALSAWACLIKPQLALFFVGFLIAWAIRSQTGSQTTRVAVRYIVAGVVWAQALMIPFDMGLPGTSARWQLLDKLREASDLYKATTLGASNVWMILSSRAWVWDSTELGPLAARSWGNIALLCLLVTLTVAAFRYREHASPVWLGTAFFFTFFMVQTRMHERYMLPVAVLAVLVAIGLPQGAMGRVGWGLAVLAQVSLFMSIEASLAIGISGVARTIFVLLAAWVNVGLWIGLALIPLMAARNSRAGRANEAMQSVRRD